MRFGVRKRKWGLPRRLIEMWGTDPFGRFLTKVSYRGHLRSGKGFQLHTCQFGKFFHEE